MRDRLIKLFLEMERSLPQFIFNQSRGARIIGDMFRFLLVRSLGVTRPEHRLWIIRCSLARPFRFLGN